MRKYKCGDNIEFEEGKWDFNSKNVSQIFVNHAEKSIPGYKNVHELVSGICKVFPSDDVRILDVGCSVGEFERELLSGWEYKGIDIIAIDSSSSMISDVVFKDSRVRYNCIEALDFLKSTEEKFDIIISLYTTQFFDSVSIKEFPKEVLNHLKDGGIFILADKFMSDDNSIDIIKEKKLFDFKLDAGFSIEEIIGKKRALRGVQTRLREDFIKSLKCQYGFSDYKVLDVNLNFMCYMFYK